MNNQVLDECIEADIARAGIHPHVRVHSCDRYNTLYGEVTAPITWLNPITNRQATISPCSVQLSGGSFGLVRPGFSVIRVVAGEYLSDCICRYTGRTDSGRKSPQVGVNVDYEQSLGLSEDELDALALSRAVFLLLNHATNNDGCDGLNGEHDEIHCPYDRAVLLVEDMGTST